jgi:hypothetical protein
LKITTSPEFNAMNTVALPAEKGLKPYPSVGKTVARTTPSSSQYPKTTTWGQEFMRRLDALHHALERDGKKLS